jgi:peptidyl-prolyl cis-trans isomerase SurA
MKKFYILLLNLCVTMVYAQSNVVDEVIWVVGDDPILLSDVEEARLQAEADGKPIEDPYCTIPEQLAIQKLFLHQASLDSVEVSEATVLKTVNERVNYFIQNLGSRENVERYFGLKLPQIKDKLAKTMRQQNMVEQVQASLTRSVKVTPAEVRSHFKDLPEDSLPLIPTEVEVQIITTHPQPTRAEIVRIEEQLREMARRVNEGEADFANLAKIYSQDPGTARVGGECGYSGRNQFVPEFSNVAFSLNDPKKVSKIVKTEYGYHIIQLIDKKGDKVNVRHILLKPQIDDSVYVKELARLDSIAADIRNNIFTFEDAAMVLSDDKDTRNNKGIMVNFNKETREISSKFTMNNLPAEVARQVEKMNVGDISKAFVYTTEQGRDVCAVIKLKSRVDSHRATLTEDFQVLKNVVLEKRRAEKLETWIKEKQRSTYVRINPEWRNCDFKYPEWNK